MLEDLWVALGTDQGKLILGFVLTTFLGAIVTYLFQSLSWRRQARLDLYKQRYKEGTDFLERLSSLIDRRYFRLQRLVWAIDGGETEEKVSVREREYFEVVLEWNQNLRSIHNGIRILIGEKQALDFLDYEDDHRPRHPKSLHYRFVLAHRSVMEAMNGAIDVSVAKREVDELNWQLSGFLFDVTTLFTRRAGSLNLLRFPDPTDSAVKDRQVSGPRRPASKP